MKGDLTRPSTIAAREQFVDQLSELVAEVTLFRDVAIFHTAHRPAVTRHVQVLNGSGD
jgi:hypothetical protein